MAGDAVGDETVTPAKRKHGNQGAPHPNSIQAKIRLKQVPQEIADRFYRNAAAWEAYHGSLEFWARQGFAT